MVDYREVVEAFRPFFHDMSEKNLIFNDIGVIRFFEDAVAFPVVRDSGNTIRIPYTEIRCIKTLPHYITIFLNNMMGYGVYFGEKTEFPPILVGEDVD